MSDFRYDTYCGLYCGACDIMDAYRRGIETGRAPEWKDLPGQFTGHLPHAEIRCHGCKTGEVFAGCNRCPIRACARKKGIAGTCMECKKYPCTIYWVFKLVSRVRKLDKRLPHWKAAPVNLKAIKTGGMENWLAEQRVKWQCPGCKTAFTWYRERCSACGREVESLKDYNRI
jgi:hypothetical protein